MIKRFLEKIYQRKQNIEPITIVSGLPRSGTSMMMKILEAGGLSPFTDNMRVADADNPNGYYELERVKQLPQGNNDWLIAAQGKVLKVIAPLLVYLPDSYPYRIIFMQRAISEMIASQRVMLRRRGEDPDQIDLEDMSQLLENNLAQLDIWLSHQPNIKRIDLSYNQLLHRPAPLLEQVNRFLDGGLNVEKMVRVIDEKLYRQRGSGVNSSPE